MSEKKELARERSTTPTPSSSSPNQHQHVHYEPDPRVQAHDFLALDRAASVSPSFIRKRGRSDTVKTFTTIQESPLRPNWHPGQEPGLDTSKPNGGRARTPTLHEECRVTVVDFSEEHIHTQQFANQGFTDFLEQSPDKSLECRWVSINGLSWDVISALGNYKGLHRLSIEDLVNIHNRTKADWYTDHTYIVLTLQKLVHLHPDEDEDSDAEDESMFCHGQPKKQSGIFRRLCRLLHGSNSRRLHDEKEDIGESRPTAPPGNGFMSANTKGIPDAPVRKLRTIQRYRAGPNEDRMAFMERNSALTAKNLAVSAEQVSIYLTGDNTVISFFESSAEDVERPILDRLSTVDTILRRSCDASMITQAIIDAIVDLAIPVMNEYQNVIGNLELEVLTQPSIKHTTNLYIATSEISTMRSIISPISSLVNALRDHKNISKLDGGGRGDTAKLASTVKVSAMAQTYLGDVEDHVIMITESLDQVSTFFLVMVQHWVSEWRALGIHRPLRS